MWLCLKIAMNFDSAALTYVNAAIVTSSYALARSFTALKAGIPG
jgi:hypothetical protein